MRIPKDGQDAPKGKSKSTEGWKDILCDRCGKSCRDNMDMNFEHARIEACWGFCSNKDLEHHEIDLCEACYDEVIKVMGIKPKITVHL